MRTVLLIIGGGIAAYKACALIRELRRGGAAVRPVLTASGARFVTPVSVAALAGTPVRTDLWEEPMAHIDLARGIDAAVVAPATAGLLSRMAAGAADDLSATALLAVEGGVPVYVAPAMNPAMWAHPAVQANVGLLQGRGVRLIGPEVGDTACGEDGPGRMAEPEAIAAAVLGSGPLAGRRAVVTSGPTWEAIDPVRVVANRSSGRQGHSIAGALAAAGAQVTLVSGPVGIADPAGVDVVRVESARQMLGAVRQALPADIFVGAAAVADWAPVPAERKIKKGAGGAPEIEFTENPDILAAVARGGARPALVVGFAAETDDLLENAQGKRAAKGADWILANAVGRGRGFDADENTVHLVTDRGAEAWPTMPKAAVARRLVARIVEAVGVAV